MPPTRTRPRGETRRVPPFQGRPTAACRPAFEQVGEWAGGHAGADVLRVAGVLEEVRVYVERDRDARVAEHAADLGHVESEGRWLGCAVAGVCCPMRLQPQSRVFASSSSSLPPFARTWLRQDARDAVAGRARHPDRPVADRDPDARFARPDGDWPAAYPPGASVDPGHGPVPPVCDPDGRSNQSSKALVVRETHLHDVGEKHGCEPPQWRFLYATASPRSSSA